MECLETLVALLPEMIEALSVQDDGTSAALLKLVAHWPAEAARAAALLLERGGGMVDVNAVRNSMFLALTAVQTAVETGNLELVRLLLSREDLRRDTIWKRSIDACQSPLETAICQDNLEMVQLLLDQLPEVPPASAKPLRVESLSSPEMVRLLAAHPRVSLDPNDYSQNLSSRTLLGTAAWKGDYDTFRALLELPGADLNIGDASNRGSVLCQAATGGLPVEPRNGQQCRQRTWNHDSGVRDRFDGHIKIIRHLLALPGVDPNAADVRGFTPIHNAASAGPPALAQAILEGAQGRIDLDRKSNHGKTPLSVAAAQNNHEVLKILLAMPGVDPTAPDTNGDTPLMCAAMGAAKECLGLLLAHPVAWQTARKPNNCGFTPLMALCEAGRVLSRDRIGTPGAYIACLRLLLQLAPNVNLRFRDSAGITPLMWAARRNNVAAMELLRQHALSRSQDLAIDEGSGGSDGVNTALVYAARSNQVDSVKWLLRHGADPNAKDGAGNGVFQLALANLNRPLLRPPSSEVKILRLLLSAGADPYAVDHEGVSPLVGFRTTNSNRHALLAMQGWVRP
ncbi:ankyrin repeat-containing domain protein [Kalaharituber pfeilii]|nr:ankyrin repeat-containing domain protein [Kalaharituber pfeilii]